jgi:sugar/nucleoside kinase (ribokinase family)
VTLGVASLGGITIDIVRGADGSYAGGLLGGNATYGAWGASLWLDDGDSHLVGLVGGDFPRPWLQAVAKAGIAVDAVEVVETVATSVWRMAYADGEQRSDLDPRTLSSDGVVTQAGSAGPMRREAQPGELEPRLGGNEDLLARLVAVHCAPVQPPVLLDNLPRLRAHPLTVLVDPGEESSTWSDDTMAEVLAQTDVYCPSLDDLAERRREDPPATAGRLCALGPGTVVVKLGAGGSLVHSGGRSILIPAAPAAVVDPTGAGDSYCGAFAAGLVRFGDPFVAGVLASATASIAVEHSGLLDCLGAHRASVRLRAQTVADRVGLALPVLTDA